MHPSRSRKVLTDRVIPVLCAVAFLPLLALVAPSAGATNASTRQPAGGTSSGVLGQAATRRLRVAVRNGTAAQGHGLLRICPHCDGVVVTTKPGSTAPLRTRTPAGLGPVELARAFHLSTTTAGPHTTIAIIDAGVDPDLASDLDVYRKQFHLPACTKANHCLHKVNYAGSSQARAPRTAAGKYLNEMLSLETSLDVDAASAACPSCRLTEISVPWQGAVEDNDIIVRDFARGVEYAVRRGIHVVSISYGYTADHENSSGSILADLSHRGVAVAASTGDNGFNGARGQTWPSALPDVVAVGGTTLGRNDRQTAWNDAGSGCAPAFAAAAGQPQSVTDACDGHRAASDVSAIADPNSGLAVYDSYAPSTHQPVGWTVVGGTSASAPYIAGLFARADDLSDVLGPSTLYAAPSKDWHDVTSGPVNGDCHAYPAVASRVCQATRGWDGPTGLGVPDGLNAFRSASSRSTQKG